MEQKEKFKMKARVIRNKYEKIVEGWSDCHDDRIIAYNIFNMLLNTCEVAANLPDFNNSINVYINEGMNKDIQTIEEIIARFDQKQDISTEYKSRENWIKWCNGE